MTPKGMEKAIFMLEVATNDPRVSEALRKKSERALRNLRAVVRHRAQQAKR